MILGQAFFSRDAATVAQELLGATLIHKLDNCEKQARIVETEAYVGTHDLACHAAKGRTKRTETMFGPAGYAYVYLIYGMHDMFNIVAGQNGDAQAVLIRAVEPLKQISGKTDGPGKLTKALGISRKYNGLPLFKQPLYLTAGQPPQRIITTARIGIDYAGAWKDAPLRFFDADSRFVSKGR